MAVATHIRESPTAIQMICFHHASCQRVSCVAEKICSTPMEAIRSAIASSDQSISRMLRYCATLLLVYLPVGANVASGVLENLLDRDTAKRTRQTRPELCLESHVPAPIYRSVSGIFS